MPTEGKSEQLLLLIQPVVRFMLLSSPRRREDSAERSGDAGRNVMLAKAVVFLRRSGADGIGHVGWAFDNADGTFTTGSIENPRHTFYTNPHDMGFWVVRVRDPISPMRARRYH